jgi:Phosphotransferase system, mannose/fructose/N-acetylgalactosamine-specific component IIC
MSISAASIIARASRKASLRLSHADEESQLRDLEASGVEVRRRMSLRRARLHFPKFSMENPSDPARGASIALLGALLGLDVVSFPQVMVSRPIVSATLAGAFIGNPPGGLLIGVVLEMIALDTLPFGASRYPEWGSAGVVEGPCLLPNRRRCRVRFRHVCSQRFSRRALVDGAWSSSGDSSSYGSSRRGTG